MPDRAAELRQTVEARREALRLAPPGTPELATRSNDLGAALFQLYQVSEEETCLEEALASFKQATEIGTPNSEELSIYWHNWSTALRARYVLKESPDDIEVALQASEKAVASASSDNLPLLLNGLANWLRVRYERAGKIGDLERAIQSLEQAASLAPPDSPVQATLLNGLGSGLAELYQRTGEPATLVRAVEALERGLELNSEESPHRPVLLGNLAMARLASYELNGRPEDLASSISCFERAVAASRPGSPQLSPALAGWSQALQKRHARDGDPEDLGLSLEAIRKAVDLTPHGSPDRPLRLDSLGNRLIDRFQQTGEASDLQEAIKAFGEAVASSSPDSPNLPGFLNNLGNGVRHLYHRTGDLWNLEQAIELYRIAIDKKPSTSPAYLSNLGASLMELYVHSGDPEHLEGALSSSEKAVETCAPDSPALPGYLTNLGTNLRELYVRTGDLKVLARAIESFERAASLLPSEASDRSKVLNSWSLALRLRYERTGDLGDLDQAVERSRRAVEQSPRDAPSRLRFLTNLSATLTTRFERTSEIQDLQEAVQTAREAVERTAPGSSDLATRRNNLAACLLRLYEHTGRAEDFQTALDNLEEAVRLTPTSSADRPGRVANLGNILLAHFKRSGERHDLESAIACLEEAAAQTPEGSPLQPGRSSGLAGGLKARHDVTGDPEDLERAVRMYETAARIGLEVSVEDALRSARDWLTWAFERRAWDEVCRAFGSAREVSDRLLKIQPLRSGKEAWLRESQGLATFAAYAMARAHLLRDAVLALEQGRAQLLVETLERDQADLERLRGDHPDLYEAYRRSAERVAWLEMGSRSALEELPPGFDLIAEARTARRDLDAAIARIREIPEFAEVFSSPRFEDVQRACEPNEAMALVYLATTPAGGLALLLSARQLDRVWLDLDQSELDGLLMRTTREGDDVSGFLPGMLSGEGLGDELARLLPVLGERLMRPVAQRLRELEITDVVLIPSGRLTLLPLHAACWTSDDGMEVFLDRFVTTYAPNARALIVARRLLGQRNETPSLVGIGNPLSPTARRLSAAQDEVRNIAAFFPQDSRRLFEGDRATRAAVLANLPEGTHLHFACHGIFEFEDPPSSRLELSGPEALTLRDLLHGEARPARARLAVLSACQSAVSDFNRLPDELIGLPAGFLQAGVPGVIGTLWQVDDLAAALLMIKLYELHLTGDSRSGEGPLAPPAALQRAVQWLRHVTRQELKEIFDRRQDREKGPLLSPETGTAGLIRTFSADHPQARPFADRPGDWAAFISVGL